MDDPNHCGSCDEVCGAGTVCFDGACATSCGGGTTQCGQSCVDTTIDAKHCGDCATICDKGIACVNGTCASTCIKGQTQCGLKTAAPYCADLATDSANCGTCGTQCELGQTCSGGTCAVVCSAGLTLCGADCVDTSTDVGHCGSCGATCGGTCAAGRCTTQLVHVGAPAMVAVDSKYVYWTEDGRVGAALLANPLATYDVDVESGSRHMWGIAVGQNPGAIYWTEQNVATGSVLSSSTFAFQPGTVATNQDSAAFVALDDVNVYWSSFGYVRGAPRSGGAAFDVMTGLYTKGIAADGKSLYWNQGTDIVSLPIGGLDAGTPTVIQSNQDVYTSGLKVDGSNVYWVATNLGTLCIRQCPKSGGAVIDLVCANFEVNAFAVDSAYVYFVEWSTGVFKVPVGGGAVTKLVDVSVYLGGENYGIAVDGTSVYWTEPEGYNKTNGGIYRVTPK